MWRLIVLSIIQSVLLSSGQVFLKIALERLPAFAWTRQVLWAFLTNWQFAVCGLCYGGASLLWMYILKNFPFSMAYPMVSLSYVIGMLAAVFIFHEEVPAVRWLGVLLIMTGCCLIAK